MPIGETHGACPHIPNRTPRTYLPDVQDGLTHWQRHAEYPGAADRGEAAVHDTCLVLTILTMPLALMLPGLPPIPPPCGLRQFPLAFVFGFLLCEFHAGVCV